MIYMSFWEKKKKKNKIGSHETTSCYRLRIPTNYRRIDYRASSEHAAEGDVHIITREDNRKKTTCAF